MKSVRRIQPDRRAKEKDVNLLGVTRSLLKNQKSSSSALYFASLKGRTETVRELLKVADPSYCYNHAIRSASEYGHIDVVRELLNDPRVDPSVLENRAIFLAAYGGHKEVVSELLKDVRVLGNLSLDDLKVIENSMGPLQKKRKIKK